MTWVNSAYASLVNKKLKNGDTIIQELKNQPTLFARQRSGWIVTQIQTKELHTNVLLNISVGRGSIVTTSGVLHFKS